MDLTQRTLNPAGARQRLRQDFDLGVGGRSDAQFDERGCPAWDAALDREAIGPKTVVAMTAYIALIHKEPNSDFGVSFPDPNGCITAGKTLDEARAMAVEALELHLEGFAADGKTLPHPQA